MKREYPCITTSYSFFYSVLFSCRTFVSGISPFLWDSKNFLKHILEKFSSFRALRVLDGSPSFLDHSKHLKICLSLFGGGGGGLHISYQGRPLSLCSKSIFTNVNLRFMIDLLWLVCLSTFLNDIMIRKVSICLVSEFQDT